MKRYGIKWNGPTSPLAVPMDDGYWTPWHEAQAQLAAVTAQRDELLRAAKLAIREIRPSTDCSMCHDSTWDHECDSKVNTTHVALSNAIKGALASEQMQPPKPVAWPHLPEVDRPDSEVQP